MSKYSKTWKITYNKFEPQKERLREAICTLGNGYFATRGAAPESSASKFHYPGTYIAGVYNRLETRIAGKMVSNEDLVNCPNWLSLSFRIEDDEWINPEINKILFYLQELNMQTGILFRKIRLKDKKGRRMTIETQRIVNMADCHQAAIRYSIILENYEGWITIKSSLDGTVKNTGVERYKDLSSEHLLDRRVGDFGKRGIYLSVKTSQSDIEISQASIIHILSGEKEIKPSREILAKEKKKVFQEFRIYARKSQRYDIEKIVAMYTSKDKGVHNPLQEAISSVKKSGRFSMIFNSHKRAWHELWKKFDIQIKGDIFSQAALRMHIFHLLQTASFHNLNIDTGLPARGLHGEAYRGHIFWDEIFIMHFFDLHAPEISKALLLYRYRRLAQARKYATENGYKGSMFPWQSGSTGKEETQTVHLNPRSGKWDPDHSHLQRHVSLAIAYNVYCYWRKTEDWDFLINYGAEIFLSIAQFAASLLKYNPKDKKFHTEGLMGPDEFHEKLPRSPKFGFRDNSYTNLLIAWILHKTEEITNILPENHRSRIFKKIDLDRTDLDSWQDATDKINLIINNNGIISQFDGYFSLKEFNWLLYKIRYRKIKRLDRILKARKESPNEYKISKQADALMIFYLLSVPEIKTIFNRLGYDYEKSLLQKNYDYYIKRTSHGSTLSKVVHCYLSHLLGREKEAWEWYLSILKSDLYDTQGGTTPEGVHTGVMGGSIDILMRRFAGIELSEQGIQISPSLPKHWMSIKFKFLHKKNWIYLSIAKKQITIFIYAAQKGKIRVPVIINDSIYHLSNKKIHRIALD